MSYSTDDGICGAFDHCGCKDKVFKLQAEKELLENLCQGQAMKFVKLKAVVDAAKGLVALLEETEETDDGREFHPVTISSCRVHKTSLIAEYLKSIKEVESE